MERAMGYVVECSDKAQEYKEETKKGMQEDAETAIYIEIEIFIFCSDLFTVPFLV